MILLASRKVNEDTILRFYRLICLTIFAMLFFATIVGCGDKGPKPIVPKKPLLSAEEAKKNAEKEMKQKLKAFEEQAKGLKK